MQKRPPAISELKIIWTDVKDKLLQYREMWTPILLLVLCIIILYGIFKITSSIDDLADIVDTWRVNKRR